MCFAWHHAIVKRLILHFGHFKKRSVTLVVWHRGFVRVSPSAWDVFLFYLKTIGCSGLSDNTQFHHQVTTDTSLWHNECTSAPTIAHSLQIASLLCKVHLCKRFRNCRENRLSFSQRDLGIMNCLELEIFPWILYLKLETILLACLKLAFAAPHMNSFV